jgi:hypothetical protein
MPDASFYNRLYRLQDEVLGLLKGRTRFYLTGGTAVSRFHYGHRYSDDLGFFIPYSQDYRAEVVSLLGLIQSGFDKVKVALDTETFVRLYVETDVELKIELVHDVEFHAGEFVENNCFDRVDNPRNILSNKLSALPRRAGKDIADIVTICSHEHFLWPEIFEEVNQKDTWVNVIATISYLSTADLEKALTEVHWIEPPTTESLRVKIDAICHDMAHALPNSLAIKR